VADVVDVTKIHGDGSLDGILIETLELALLERLHQLGKADVENSSKRAGK